VFRRRRRDDDGAPNQPVGDHEPSPAEESPTDPPPEEATSPKSDRSGGPFDAAEVDLDDARRIRVDLGGLLVGGVDGMKLQLQVDKRTGNATSALFGLPDAAVQLVAVAAPRSSGLWEQTRLQIAADARRRGGSADEAVGPFGPEVRIVVPVTTADGKQGLQPSRVSGIDGPRWLLRATFLGKATSDAGVFQRLVDIVRSVVVIRGDGPMAPGDVIVLSPPPGSQAQQAGTTPPEPS
jgi:hypothetical protein